MSTSDAIAFPRDHVEEEHAIIETTKTSTTMGGAESKPIPHTESLSKFDDLSLHRQLVRERSDKFSNVYELLREIGRGGVCKVFLIKKKQDQIGGSSRAINIKRRSLFRNYSPSGKHIVYSHTMEFAMKEIDLKKVPDNKIEQLKGEVAILKAMDHKNIIKAYETFEEKRKILIVMELCTGGDLASRFPYSEEQVAKITRQLLSAVSYIHRMGVIHRDIKLENIMFETTHSYMIKLIDFGLSKEYYTNMSERVGTLYSMSPETLRGDYTTQADLWSIGVVAYMLLSNGTKPFGGESSSDLVRFVLKGEYNPGPIAHVSDLARDFLSSLLVVEPTKRSTAHAAKKHPWIIHHNSPEFSDETLKKRVFDNLLNYANTGEFAKLALNVIAKRSSWTEIEELRKVFDDIDTENTGTVDRSEFKKALSGQYSEDDLESIFQSIDVNNNNEINYTEFLAAAIETQFIEEYRLAEAFDLLDSDDSGYISRDNLRKILGDHVEDSYIEKLIAEADFYKDGRISYKEFLQVFNRHLDSEDADDDDKEASIWKGIRNSIRISHRRLSSASRTSSR